MRREICFILVCFLVLISGCIKVQIREDVDSSGKSDLTMILEPLNVSAFGWDKKDPCNEFNSTSSKYFSGGKCTFDGKRERVTGKFDRKLAGGLTITGTHYHFDLVRALQSFNENKSASSQTGLQEHKNATQIKQLKDAGVAYDYIVKLPGKVSKQSGGVVQSDGSVKFDLLELEAADKPYVESDSSVLGILGGVSPKSDSEQKIKETPYVSPSKGMGNVCSCIPALSMFLAGLGAALAKSV